MLQGKDIMNIGVWKNKKGHNPEMEIMSFFTAFYIFYGIRYFLNTSSACINRSTY